MFGETKLQCHLANDTQRDNPKNSFTTGVRLNTAALRINLEKLNSAETNPSGANKD